MADHNEHRTTNRCHSRDATRRHKTTPAPTQTPSEATQGASKARDREQAYDARRPDADAGRERCGQAGGDGRQVAASRRQRRHDPRAKCRRARHEASASSREARQAGWRRLPDHDRQPRPTQQAAPTAARAGVASQWPTSSRGFFALVRSKRRGRSSPRPVPSAGHGGWLPAGAPWNWWQSGIDPSGGDTVGDGRGLPVGLCADRRDVPRRSLAAERARRAAIASPRRRCRASCAIRTAISRRPTSC